MAIHLGGTPLRQATFGLIAIAAATVAIGAAAAGSASSPAAGSGTAALSCALAANTAAGSVLLQPTVTSATPASGSYRLTLDGGSAGGNASISQGGAFTALAGRPTTLGAVSLDAGGIYRARLTVSAGGSTVSCTRTIGGAL